MKRRASASEELRALGLNATEAGKVVYALYHMGQRLVELSPDARLLVLKALCATFLTDEPAPIFKEQKQRRPPQATSVDNEAKEK